MKADKKYGGNAHDTTPQERWVGGDRLGIQGTQRGMRGPRFLRGD